MSVFLGWMQIVLIVVAMGVVFGAVVAAAVSSAWMDRIRSVAPRTRFKLLTGLAVLPAALGLLSPAIIFAPSILDAAGWVEDHCAAHSHHAFHLCFVHDTPPEPAPLILGAGIILAIWVGAGWSQNLARLRRSSSLERGLRDMTTYDAGADIWRMDSERAVAMTLGLFRPRIYVSRRLEALLEPVQLDAVVAHERSHARHFDALFKYIATLGAELHAPGVAEAILEELDLACEQACDAEAAEQVGDGVTVAEAILAVERASGGAELPAHVLGFSGEVIAARIEGLLEPRWFTLPRTAMFAVAALVGCSLAGLYDHLHHAAETVVSYLF